MNVNLQYKMFKKKVCFLCYSSMCASYKGVHLLTPWALRILGRDLVLVTGLYYQIFMTSACLQLYIKAPAGKDSNSDYAHVSMVPSYLWKSPTPWTLMSPHTIKDAGFFYLDNTWADNSLDVLFRLCESSLLPVLPSRSDYLHHISMMVSQAMPPQGLKVMHIQQRFPQEFPWLSESFNNVMYCRW